MDKPVRTHRILALIGGTELLGKERGNLEALSALKRRSNSDGGVSIESPTEVKSEPKHGGGDSKWEFPMGSHFSTNVGCSMTRRIGIDNSNGFGPTAGNCCPLLDMAAQPT